MKKLILFAALGLAATLNARNISDKSNLRVATESFMCSVELTRYLITIKTICGTTFQTIFDTEYDSEECLYNEWEMYNFMDCGHASYENPLV